MPVGEVWTRVFPVKVFTSIRLDVPTEAWAAERCMRSLAVQIQNPMEDRILSFQVFQKSEDFRDIRYRMDRVDPDKDDFLALIHDDVCPLRESVLVPEDPVLLCNCPVWPEIAEEPGVSDAESFCPFFFAGF